METFTIFAITFGILLILLETILPGGLSFCLGLSTLIVGVGYQFNFIKDPFDIFVYWSFLSLFLSTMSFLIMNKFFSGDEIKQHCSDDNEADAFGKKALVTEDVTQESGRIQFRGTSWLAVSLGQFFLKGESVTIVSRDNLTWIVEANEI